MERAFRASIATITDIEAEERPLPVEATAPLGGAGGFVRHLARELLEGAPGLRIRAAGRLVELLGMEASSLLCAALEEETDPELLVGFCGALGRTRDPDALDWVLTHASHEHPMVRAAAWEAALSLAPAGLWEELVEQGFLDPAPTVRRRLLLAVASLPGVDLGPWAARCLRDEDPQVRRLGSVALGRGASSKSEGILPFAELEAPLLAAIRGLTPSELAAQVGRGASEVEASLERYLEDGRVVRRGRKIFLP